MASAYRSIHISKYYIHVYMSCIYSIIILSWQASAVPDCATDSIKDVNGTVYLEDYCSPSPKELLVTSKNNYGGKLVLFPNSQHSCNTMAIKFVVHQPLTDLRYYLYFNVGESTMSLGDAVMVYEQLPFRALSEIKKIVRDDTKKGMRHSARSFGQMKTSYFSSSIILQLELTRTGKAVSKCDQVILEYTTVVESIRSAHEKKWVYCSALNGYVNRELSCNMSRMTCPDKFSANIQGSNPASALDKRPCIDGPETSGLYREDFRAPPSILSNGWSVRNAMRIANNSTIFTRPENAEIAGGLLRITAQTVAYNVTHASYYAGQVSSGSLASLTYGEVEIRAKLPAPFSMTVITAMRLVNLECNFDDSPACEEGILIAEVRSDIPNSMTMGVSNGRRRDRVSVMISNWTSATEESLADSQFHVFKLNWTEEFIVWSIDETELRNLSTSALIPSATMQIVVELTILPGPNPVNATPELVVDYITVRQHAQAPSDWKIWVGIATPTSVTVLAIFTWFWRKRRHRLDYGPGKRPGPLSFAYKLEEGEFGVIWKATAYELLDHPVPCTVAVKCVRDRSDASHHKVLKREAGIQSLIGKHRNIVGFLGVILSDQIYLILEYSPNGNLLQHLRDHAKIFGNNGCDEDYVNAKISTAFSADRIPSGWPLTTADLVDFVCQISWGMEYLANKDIIHGDLAARNILVYQKNVLKIGDFGMAKQAADCYYMTDIETAKVPAKWMAPESLQQLMFSKKSDVWSFGVVAWEIFSFGEVPYDSLLELFSYNAFVSALLNGLRLLKPKECPAPMFDVMMDCWKLCDGDRPTFAAINRKIDPLMRKESRRTYVEWSDPYVILSMSSTKSVSDLPTTEQNLVPCRTELINGEQPEVHLVHRHVSGIESNSTEDGSARNASSNAVA